MKFVFIMFHLLQCSGAMPAISLQIMFLLIMRPANARNKHSSSSINQSVSFPVFVIYSTWHSDTEVFKSCFMLLHVISLSCVRHQLLYMAMHIGKASSWYWRWWWCQISYSKGYYYFSFNFLATDDDAPSAGAVLYYTRIPSCNNESQPVSTQSCSPFLGLFLSAWKINSSLAWKLEVINYLLEHIVRGKSSLLYVA